MAVPGCPPPVLVRRRREPSTPSHQGEEHHPLPTTSPPPWTRSATIEQCYRSPLCTPRINHYPLPTTYRC